MFGPKLIPGIAIGKCARFTLSGPDRHYTYKITAASFDGGDTTRNFAFLLTGQDNGENSGSWTYLGEIRNNQLFPTRKTAQGMENSKPFTLLNRVVARLALDEYAAILAAGYSLLHVGACLRCNAELTVPESIESGYGPICLRRIQGE